jgi:CDP-diacylglycerol--glycerol-3-phosphate 3-phosphatidyltransferase
MSLLVALFWTRNLAVASWYVTAVAVNWVLGAALYYLVPSVGPIYAKPSLFSDLPELPTTAIARTWMEDRVAMLADPFGTPALQTVAAFASLHVSVMVTAALVAWFGRLRPMGVHWALWFFLVLNVLATVYLGWHYVVDVFGGVGVGVAAVWIAAYGTGNGHRLPRLVSSSTGTRADSRDRLPTPTGHARPDSERFWTPPTVVTAIRTVGSVVLTAIALQLQSVPLLFAGLAVYWVGDIVDGWLARRLDRETRTGGVTDILCDRLCAGLFYLGVLLMMDVPEVPVVLYLAEFMVVDLMLSLAFLAWPLVSPNYFYLVDRPTWLLNWSPVAKSLNSAAFLAALLLTGSAVAATVVALTLLTIKSLSLVRVVRLRAPAPSRSSVPVLRPSRTPTS